MSVGAQTIADASPQRGEVPGGGHVAGGAAARASPLSPIMSIVYEATTGEAALELARTHLSVFILMDLQLPGVDGYAVTRRLKVDAVTRRSAIRVRADFLSTKSCVWCGKKLHRSS